MKKEVEKKVQEEGINPTKLGVFMKWVDYHYSNMLALGGNCGIFAAGLNDFLENFFDVEVTLKGVFNEHTPEGFHHVGVKWEEKYFDIDGKQDKPIFKRWAYLEDHPDAKIHVTDTSKDEIRDKTVPDMDKSFFEKQIEEYIELFKREWKLIEEKFTDLSKDINE